jgi:hypothetical protein
VGNKMADNTTTPNTTVILQPGIMDSTYSFWTMLMWAGIVGAAVYMYCNWDDLFSSNYHKEFYDDDDDEK